MGLFDSLFSALGGGPKFQATGGGMGFQGPVKQPFNWALLAKYLGDLGAAISPRGSWQQNVGATVGKTWAPSAIYAKAATKAQPNFQDYINWISGSVTPPGTPGPTMVEMDKNGELKMKMTPPQTPAQASPTPQSTYSNVTKGGMLPFLLAP